MRVPTPKERRDSRREGVNQRIKGERWTYKRHVGGLMRCCLFFLDDAMVERREAGQGPPRDGDTLTTGYCHALLVHRDGAWERQQ